MSGITVGLNHLGYIQLPAHMGQGGFDHAAVDRGRALLYLAHTANDALAVIDTGSATYVRSVPDLKGVAGALVHEPSGMVFTSNRGENTVGIFSAGAEERLAKVAVGVGPNGLAYDPVGGTLLCANVGDPGVAGSASVTLVDVATRSVLATVTMPGRTRWAIFNPESHVFFVNIADPPQIAVVDPRAPQRVVRIIDVPARGPHGLDLDASRHRLYCACDDGKLVAFDAASGDTLDSLELSGAPDVIFLNTTRSHLYVAIGDPGVVDIVDVTTWRKIASVTTEAGAHTLAIDERSSRVYVFLPGTHRASVFEDRG